MKANSLAGASVVLALLCGSVTWAGQARAQPLGNPKAGGKLDDSQSIVTVPAATPSDASTEVETIARMRGVSVQEARDNLIRQDTLVRFADKYRSDHPDRFVDFKLDSTDALSATLLVEPNSEVASELSAGELKVKKIEAKSNRKERNAEKRQAATLLDVSEEEMFYDPFTDTLTVSLPPAKKAEADKKSEDVERTLRTRADKTGPKIRVEEIGPDNDGISDGFFGGKLVSKSTGFCTSGFGVWKAGIGGYTTSGHCGAGPWTVNGYTSSSVQDFAVGGYLDREVVVAGGASWLVAVGSVNEDMAAIPDQWMYQNTTYCTYSAQINQQSCGQLSSWPTRTSPYNLPLVPGGAGGSASVLVTTTNMVCKPGDSGGPMWRPVPGGESKPVGTVEGSRTDWFSPNSQGQWPCAFMKLHDQLTGTGWQLL